jgi:hypothetical protein
MPRHAMKITPPNQEFLVFSEYRDGEGHLCCPACGEPENGLHLLRVEVLRGGGEGPVGISGYSGHDHRTLLRDNDELRLHGVSLRGTRVITFYGCEACGRSTAFVQQFHKGTVRFFFLRTANDMSADGEFFPRDELWRD